MRSPFLVGKIQCNHDPEPMFDTLRIRLRNKNSRLRNYQTHPSADMLWSVYQSKTGQLRNRQSKKESANGKETKA